MIHKNDENKKILWENRQSAKHEMQEIIDRNRQFDREKAIKTAVISFVTGVVVGALLKRTLK